MTSKKPGMYVYGVRFPANFKVQPYFHPDERVVTRDDPIQNGRRWNGPAAYMKRVLSGGIGIAG